MEKIKNLFYFAAVSIKVKNLFYLLFALFVACSPDLGKEAHQTPKIKQGHWLLEFNIGKEKIPVNAFFSDKNDTSVFIFKNADETILTENIFFLGDSVFITLPVFGTKIEGEIKNDSTFNGLWYNTTKAADYKLPFHASYNKTRRFSPSEKVPADFSGKWEVTFSPGKENANKALGSFEQSDDEIKGTFMTETGDYRYLQGNVDGEIMQLSCFDGAHAFLFKSSMIDKDTIKGSFWSGNHWQEDWIAVRNSKFKLRHPDSINVVHDSASLSQLVFQTLEGSSFPLNDPSLSGKVVVLQIMGTWCPNCMDEARDFSMFYENFNNEGLEVLAVCFERSDKLEEANRKIKRFKRETGAQYPFLFGGAVERVKKDRLFSLIGGISSYPTAVYIDRSGKIRKVSSGYYGPGTGIYHERYLSASKDFIEKLLNEEVSN